MRIYKNSFTLMIIAASILTSCDEPDSYSSIQESTKYELREYAGTLARYYALPPCDSLRPDKPQDSDLMALIETCETNPEAWSYLYSCIADSFAVIEPALPACQ
jgi:hypothetical protein